MSDGRKVALRYALSLPAGLALWAWLPRQARALLRSSVYALMGIKVSGGLYLLCLVLTSAHTACHREMQQLREPKDSRWFVHVAVQQTPRRIAHGSGTFMPPSAMLASTRWSYVADQSIQE